MRDGDTIVALSSGSVPAGVAVIRLSGPATRDLLLSLAGDLPPPRRLSMRTLRDADWLIVLEHGRVAEQGTHDELMQKRGTFYKLVEAQQQMNAVLTVGG